MRNFIHNYKEIVILEIILAAILIPTVFIETSKQHPFAASVIFCMTLWIACWLGIIKINSM